ncbi:MAG: HDOD domain-containing protein [Myxococcota bacterium]
MKPFDARSGEGLDELCMIAGYASRPRRDLVGLMAQCDRVEPSVLERFRQERQELPMLSTSASQLLSIVPRFVDMEIDEIVSAVEFEPNLVARLLTLANSAYYRRASEIESLKGAISRIGRVETGSTTAVYATQSLFNPNMNLVSSMFAHRWYRLQHDSAVAAYGTSWLCRSLELCAPSQGFLAGLLHDVGKGIVLNCIGHLVTGEQFPFELYGTTAAELQERLHCDVGVEALIQWQLPEYLVEVCAEHHAPEPDAGPHTALVHAVRVVSGFNTLRSGAYPRATLDDEIRQSLRWLALDAPTLRKLGAVLTNAVEQVTRTLGPAPKSARDRTQRDDSKRS